MSIPPDTTSLTFQQANDHQLDLIWALNASAWASPLSPAAHIVRERWLSEQPLTGHKWRTFLLFRHEDEIIASCEVFEKEIVVCDGLGGRRERGYGVASVYTNPVFRRQGMAGLLLGRVAGWMDGVGGGVVSVLYSDIGKVYYEKLGWTPYSTRQLVLESTTELSDMGDLADVYPLGDEQMEDLCREDIHALEKEFSQPPGDSDHHIHYSHKHP
ncbi:putative Xaa-Pro aminopeptidase P [Venturia inaequalis]|nr:putative Xaa-Pro aminopeptidase P [Venturia inaequalis]